MAQDKTNSGNGVLNLDALYGVEKPLIFRWQGKEHQMTRPQAMGPRQMVQFQALRERANAIENFGELITPQQADDLESVMNEMLTIVCPTVDAAAMPYAARMNTMLWYFGETNPKETAELQKKMTPPAPNSHARRTMAKVSRR